MNDGGPAIDIDALRAWCGRTSDATDVIDAALVERFAATLDLDAASTQQGSPAPVGIHWCLAPEVAATASLGPDGHPTRGGFLPPVSLPRRMWAGGELRFSGVFTLGDTVNRLSTIEDVQIKHGRTGALCFVTVRHDYAVDGKAILSERQDIVYREAETPGAMPQATVPLDAQPASDAQRTVDANSVMLFRYSALTFNGHRIHYDRRYCLEEENYPGLVVHGPLQATVLLHLATGQADGRMPARFSFRGQAPLFDGAFTAHARRDGDGMKLWVLDPFGRRTMQAEATWA